MRRIFALALVATLPVLAHAQVGASTVQSAQPSAMLLARATPPAGIKAPDAASPVTPFTTSAIIPLNLVIKQAVFSADQYASLEQANGLTNIFNGEPITESSAPQLIKAVKTQLTPQQLVAGSLVKVHLTVGRNGIPYNVSLVSATNPIIAQKTLAVVSQYRFKPATLNRIPVEANVTVDVSIH